MTDRRDWTLMLTCALSGALVLGLLVGGCETSQDAAGGSTDSGAGGGDGAGAGGADDAGPGGAGDASPGGRGSGGGGDDGAAPTGVVINELATAGSGEDWIELYNRGTGSVSLAGWSMTDSDPLSTFTFAADAMIGGGEHLVLTRRDPGSFEFGLGRPDGLWLYDATGAQRDATSWGADDAGAGWSWGRTPDGTGDFTTLSLPTPGEPNAPAPNPSCGDGVTDPGETCDGTDMRGADCEQLGFAGGVLACAGSCAAVDTSGCEPPSQLVVINEVSASDDDPIELLNPGSAAVDVSGWTLTDKNLEPVEGAYVFAPGSSIAAGEYVVLRKGSDHAFGIGADDVVQLRDDEGVLVDKVSWAGDDAAVSLCRLPDGEGSPRPCDPPSFGATNH